MKKDLSILLFFIITILLNSCEQINSNELNQDRKIFG